MALLVVVVLRVSVSRVEMMRVWKAEKTVGVFSGYASCMFAGHWRTLILALGVTMDSNSDF